MNKFTKKLFIRKIMSKRYNFVFYFRAKRENSRNNTNERDSRKNQE